MNEPEPKAVDAPVKEPKRKLTNKEIKTYLGVMHEYQLAASNAGTEWRKAFIELASAKRSKDYGEHNYDLRAKSVVLLDNNKLAWDNKDNQNPMRMFDVFPPKSLVDAQKAFRAALEYQVRAHQLVRELDLLGLDH